MSIFGNIPKLPWKGDNTHCLNRTELLSLKGYFVLGLDEIRGKGAELSERNYLWKKYGLF